MKNIFVMTIIGLLSSALLNPNTNLNFPSNLTSNSGEIIQLEKTANIQFNTSKYFLAINGTEKLDYTFSGDTTQDISLIFEIEDANICTIDENHIIHGISPGNTIIYIYNNNNIHSIEVTVTDLITLIPDEPDSEKELITGKVFSKEDNDLLDAILSDRIQKAGYKTRAGAVAAARFIGLEFPYRIPYFSENGRLNTYGWTTLVDGEGRYYHKGLYLHSSRYALLSKTLHGPGTWGTYIYSIPSKGKRANGLDCSGFIAWLLYNAGFEPGDVGAGITSIPDMTDLGDKILLKDSITNNKLKAGDLLSGKGSSGGHIALITGFKDEKYYIAESLWHGSGYFGAIIRTYDYDSLNKNFYWHIDMDKFYIEDGNYTSYWK